MQSNTMSHWDGVRLAQVDGTMIMETPDETQQISVDGQGNPVYAGTGYFLYGLTFVLLFIAAVVVVKTSKKMQRQPPE